MAKEDGGGEIIQFQAQRTITVLCKSFLNLLEDLQEEYDRRLESWQVQAKNTLVSANDFLDEKHYDYLRKKVLDKGGELNRELQAEMDKYDFILKRNGNENK
jgi:hypothetical protein